MRQCWYPTPRIADAIAANCDLGVVCVILFRTNFTYHHGVAYFLSLVRQNVLVVDEEEGVSSCNPLGTGSIPRADALAQTSKIIGVRGIPRCFVMGIVTELAMLK
jgi:hypothetical protein